MQIQEGNQTSLFSKNVAHIILNEETYKLMRRKILFRRETDRDNGIPWPWIPWHLILRESELISTELREIHSHISAKGAIHIPIWHDDLAQSQIPRRSSRKAHIHVHRFGFRIDEGDLRRYTFCVLDRNRLTLKSVKDWIVGIPTSWEIFGNWWLMILTSSIDNYSRLIERARHRSIRRIRIGIRNTCRKHENTEYDECPYEHKEW